MVQEELMKAVTQPVQVEEEKPSPTHGIPLLLNRIEALKGQFKSLVLHDKLPMVSDGF
jgi:hypothetical protein